MPDPVAGGVSRFAWTSVKPKQQSKQYSPKLVTELGIVMLVKPEHFEYLLLVDYQYYTL